MVNGPIVHQCRFLKIYLLPNQPPTGLIAADGVIHTPSAVAKP
jgi:hypothetical protein